MANGVHVGLKLKVVFPFLALLLLDVSRRFGKTCEAMKADGIEIYTIAFALNNDAEGNATREMFRTCATDRNTHFFSAATGADLNNAFVTIAAELIRLRLAQ